MSIQKVYVGIGAHLINTGIREIMRGFPAVLVTAESHLHIGEQFQTEDIVAICVIDTLPKFPSKVLRKFPSIEIAQHAGCQIPQEILTFLGERPARVIAIRSSIANAPNDRESLREALRHEHFHVNGRWFGPVSPRRRERRQKQREKWLEDRRNGVDRYRYCC